MAAWSQHNGTRYVVNASRYQDGAWSAPVQVDNPAVTGDVNRPEFAMDGAGNTTIVWDQDNGTRNVVYASRYSDGAWSAPAQLGDPAATKNASSPAIAVDSTGNMMAVWQQSNGTRYLIHASTYKNGAWSAPAQVDSPTATGSAYDPKIAMDGVGNAIAAWYQHNGTRHVVYTSRYSNGAWSAPVRVDNGTATEEAYSPAMGLDAAGNLMAVWVQINGTTPTLNFARLE